MNLFNNQVITLKINEIKFNELYDFLVSCDNDFIPSLSSKVNIYDYSIKLLKNSEIISLICNEKLIGLLAIYCNNFINKEAFISVVCLSKDYRGYGLSKVLLEKSIEIAKNKNFLKIKLEVNKNNKIAIKLYNKFGFKKILENSETIIMQYDIK